MNNKERLVTLTCDLEKKINEFIGVCDALELDPAERLHDIIYDASEGCIDIL